MLRRALLVLLSSLALTACDSGYKSTINYSIHFHEGDINGTTVAEDDHIDGDDSQWKAFLNSAKTELGEAPQEFDIDRVRLQLDVARSKNLGKLEDLLKGEGALYLRSESGAQVDIATFEDLEDSGTAEVEVDLTGNDLKQVYSALAASNFRLGLRGETALTRDTDFEATVRVILDVTAR
jgi:hypothetical protein